jgi:hypothetical protein
MPKPQPEPIPRPPFTADARRNYRLGVLNGAVYMMGECFVDAGAWCRYSCRG